MGKEIDLLQNEVHDDRNLKINIDEKQGVLEKMYELTAYIFTEMNTSSKYSFLIRKAVCEKEMYITHEIRRWFRHTEPTYYY